VLNRVESTDYSRATTVVYTQEYPTLLPKVEIGQMSRLIARCLPIYNKCVYTAHELYTLLY